MFFVAQWVIIVLYLDDYIDIQNTHHETKILPQRSIW
jgi:hypothetical protein